MSAGIVSTSINAGDITATGNGNPTSGHQLRMGNNLFIHITPEVARQWLPVIAEIADGNTPKSPESSGISIE